MKNDFGSKNSFSSQRENDGLRNENDELFYFIETFSYFLLNFFIENYKFLNC